MNVEACILDYFGNGKRIYASFKYVSIELSHIMRQKTLKREFRALVNEVVGNKYQ